MPLNKQKGNMYGFVDFTWNPIRGRCPHKCIYCYMKDFPVGELRLDTKCLKDNLGEGRFIFVGSSTDMFSIKVPSDWINQVLEHCKKFDNTYLFQSKNTINLGTIDLRKEFPAKTILGTTLETNRDTQLISIETDATYDRTIYFRGIKGRKMVSIEPILDFDLDVFTKWIKEIDPEFVSIGADSQNHHLLEPPADKIKALIKELKTFTKVIEKPNLGRLLG